MNIVCLVFWTEELSMRRFLESWLKQYLPGDNIAFRIFDFRGKDDMKNKLKKRIRAYRSEGNFIYKHFVVMDRDRDDCAELNEMLVKICASAGFEVRKCGSSWQAATCIVIEELEAWYFGDWDAVKSCYSRVSSTIPRKPRFKKSDKIEKPSQRLEKIFKDSHIEDKFRKTRIAENVGRAYNADRSTSPSFKHFRKVVDEAVASVGQ